MTLSKADLESKAIQGCDSEAIHTPGYIQPCGFMLGLDKGCNEVVYTSTNVEQYLSTAPQQALSIAPAELLSKQLIHSIRNLQGRSTATKQRELVGDIETSNGVRKAVAHVRNGTTIVEVCDLGDIPISQSEGLDRLRWLTRKIDKEVDVSGILDSAVRHLRAFSGYDRVMAYRFRPDGSGEVVAEAKSDEIEGYLGLRFPEFDIPKQARQLYIETPIRMICDIDGEQIGLVSKPGAPELDMSLAILRGTMPVHCDYLRNMDIRGSLSLPISIDGKLWGLFAFHHRQPRYLGDGVSLAIEFAGQYLNMVIRSALKAEENRSELRTVHVSMALFARREHERASEISWSLLKQNLLGVVPANGVVFCDNTGCKVHGDCPPLEALEQIRSVLKPLDDNISIVDNLPELLPDANLGATAGAMEIKIGINDNASIYYFRNEASAEILWAGSPEKILDTSSENLRLTPRGSFAAFKMDMIGRSESWEPQDIVAAIGLQKAASRAHAQSVDRDSLLENLEILVQELNHRVRNILALVESIIKHSRPDDPELHDYFEKLEARIVSLATAHNVLTQTNSRQLDLRETVKKEAEPFSLDRVSMVGPSVGISAEAASLFVLVLHELFSNAAKYGAFSTQTGRLDLTWHLTEQGLHINWTERGGPLVKEPERIGFGQTLIQNGLSYEFGGQVDVAFLPGGISVDLFLPATVLVSAENANERQGKTAQKPVLVAQGKKLHGNVLILEDDFIIAKQTQKEAEKLGAAQSLLASNNPAAMALISNNEISFGILDINLGGDRSLPIANHLAEQNIPFIFVTGYGSGEGQLAEFPDIPVVTKPFNKNEIATAISKAFEK